MAKKVNTGGGSHVGGTVAVDHASTFVGRDQITINIQYPPQPFELVQPDLVKLRADYLQYLLDTYTYLDFRGTSLLEAIEKASGLALEDVYTPLKARPELPDGETWLRMAGRLWKGEEADEVRASLAQAERGSDALPVDEMLNRVPALVILGDPGSGKSTLVKILALTLAKTDNAPLPILIPLTAYAEALEREPLSLDDFLPRYYAARQGQLRNLQPLFELALAQGQAVVLLDGLDEVQTRREHFVKLVEDFVRGHVPAPVKTVRRSKQLPPGNRVIVTSRFVGYREAPLMDARWQTYALTDWERDEITQFVRRWTYAVELAMGGGKATADIQQRAQTEQAELLQAIAASDGLARLAGNPLLLTILALIKRQGVTLPHRRVELYELYLRTLITHWRKARSLDKQPIGPDIDYLEAVQILAPLALWLREENPKAGLIHQTQLLDRLMQYYEDEGQTRTESRVAARKFVEAVHRYSNLLIERGKDRYGFIHLTFEEYLAGKGLISPFTSESIERFLRHLPDPAWHETLLLAVGALGLVSQQPASAGLLIERVLDARQPDRERGANVILAGEALLDVSRVGLGHKTANRVIAELIATMQGAEVQPRLRRQAGLLLGRLNWTPDDLDLFVEVPAGKFLYGDEKQEREISYRYWIAKYPVTNLQFKRFMAAGGYEQQQWWSTEGWDWRNGALAKPNTYQWVADKNLRQQLIDYINARTKEERSRPYWWNDVEYNNLICPVVGVSWYEVEAYSNWANQHFEMIATSGGQVTRPEKYVMRLAREDEWERAARGVDGREYPWGKDFDQAKANTEESGRIGTTTVCTYPPGTSPAGAWDMSGNVWEWTDSSYDKDTRVLRGGSWNLIRDFARCASRSWGDPDLFLDYIGFRVVVSLA